MPGRAALAALCAPVLLALAGAAGGCAAKGDNRFFYVRGSSPKPLVKADVAGTYCLYPSDSGAPRYSVELGPGEAYGFRKRADDTVVAVARDQEIELGDRFVPSYYWAPPKGK